MFQPHFQLDPREPGWGLGFELGDEGGHRLVRHSGIVSRFVSAMVLAPDAGIGVVVFSNTSGLIPPPAHPSCRPWRCSAACWAFPMERSAPTSHPAPRVLERAVWLVQPRPGPGDHGVLAAGTALAIGFGFHRRAS
jgi:hypothetical protein